MAAQE
jgi:hypothetical protein